MKCPKCGKFLKDVEADISMDNEIGTVTGTCAKHGPVHPTDWEYEDFFPFPKPTTQFDLEAGREK